jgi:hypothetical protein
MIFHLPHYNRLKTEEFKDRTGERLVTLKSGALDLYIEGHAPLFRTISQKEFHPTLDVV